MLLPLLMTTIAGLSTGLGGLIAALFRPTPRLMAFCGGFAGAVMLTVSLADLAPALLDFYGALLSPFGCGAAVAALLLGGMLAAWLLACALPDEDTLADRFGSRTQGSAMRAALVTGAALLLHNLPEGILTLLTNVSDRSWGRARHWRLPCTISRRAWLLRCLLPAPPAAGPRVPWLRWYPALRNRRGPFWRHWCWPHC